MRNHIRSFVVYVGLGMLLLTGVESYAQTNTLAKHNWYFGNTSRSIKFNRVTNAASLITNKAVPFGIGGSAVATDRGNGNLLFYTDGSRIYDANHNLMLGGSGLNGNTTANQPVAICPVPGQPSKYFVFTNTADFTTGGNISYTVVDMALFGTAVFPAPASGDVESKNNPIPILTGVSEGMITMPHQNGNDFWLITQTVNTQTFNATLINAATYTSGTFTVVTSNAANLPTTIAHLAYHEGLRKLAAAPQDANTDAVILDFNEAAGGLVFDRAILNSAVLSTTTQAIYDMEWSASGQYLYLSRHGEAGITADVLQYDYANSSVTLASVLPAPVFRSYGLQRGPDNNIYHLYQRTTSTDPFLLGRIDHPDSVASKTGYTGAPGVFAALDFGGKQFPGFVPKDTVDLRLNFTSAGTCQNSATTFFPFVRPGADSLQWDFADGNAGSGWAPIHTYAQAGAFNVTLRAFYQGQVDSVSRNVTISAFALTLQMTQDTTACRQEFPPPRGSSSPTQFQVKVNIQGGTAASIAWSNGDLGEILTPDSAGYYYVVVTDAAGCSAYAGVNVREYGLQSQTSNKWYFGDKAGIDFNKQPPQALNESAMTPPEGCAIVCDRNGQTIFYTDGNTVFDKTHTAIATGIGGSLAATQSSLIVPVPGDETIYYIFTTQAINGSDSLQLKYSLFDLKKNNGKGAVVKQNVLLFMKSGERVTASGQWLIVHELGNSTFRSYPISDQGIGNQVYSSVGTDHSLAIQQNGEGYMKLGPRDIVAVPISTPGTSNRIELFHLNDTTGTLNDYKNVNLNEPNGSIYGIEFSPAGNKLFASVRYTGGTSAIYEYSIDSLLRVRFRQRIPVAADVGAIQIGPDGQIYVAMNSSGNNTQLGTILANEDTLATSSFNLQGFALASGTVSKLGLPNFIQNNSNALGGPGIIIAGLCALDSTRFSATPRDQIDTYNWTVNRINPLGPTTTVASSTDATFAALLPGPGDYRVALVLHNRCAADTTMFQAFKITAPPVNPGRGVPICNTPTVQLDANPPNAIGLTYQWDTGETTEILTVSEQGQYNVIVTDSVGCTTTGTFLAADSRPIFDLGPDLTICEDNNTPALNVNNPGMTYAWTINSVPASTSSTQSVDVTNAGVFTYAVTVTDSVTTCFRTEDKVYTINVSPLFVMSGANPSSCGAADGSITLSLIASTPAGGPLYSYFISGPGASDSDVDQTAPNTFTINNVGAGTFSGVIQDQISGCTISAAFGLSDALYSATAAAQPPNCDPVTLRVSPVGPIVYPLQYLTTNSGTGATTTGSSAAPGAFNLTTPLPQGDYVIQLTDAGGCIFSFNQVVAPNASPAITLTPDICSLSLIASGATATTYIWTASPPSGITGNPNGFAVANLTANSGTVTYTVTGNTGSCPGTQSITLNVGNVPVPLLTPTNECASTVTINATPIGIFNYRWFRDNVYDPTVGGSSIQIGLAESGHIYKVQIFEPVSGCTKDSPQIVASVIGTVDAALSSTPPCDDGLPITLTSTTAATGVTYAWLRDGVVITGVTTATTDQTAEGRYQVDISKSSCKASASLLISRAPLPEGELPNIATICDDSENQDPTTATIDLDPGIFVSYDWTKFGVSIPYTQRVLTADSKGEYAVTITDARGCTNKDETDVRNECLPKINAPNAFRPGSVIFNHDRKDLTNSDFWIFTRFIEDDRFHVFIFNRWGEMVFTSPDRFFKWNGGYNNDAGQPLPPGTYSYVVQYVSAFRPDQGIQEKRGGVALIR
ncbi:MAG TPA: gliding motility-associated C-terminal domain-containing protein [Cyclobacteriaceae bacterium]|nr:gliding motility-associated C-terminal domain-containing protein [Cyclobacteriaceae bacterium]